MFAQRHSQKNFSKPDKKKKLGLCLTHSCPDSCLFLTDAYDTAKMLCEKYYLAAPELKIEEFNSRVALFFLVFSHPFLSKCEHFPPCNLRRRCGGKKTAAPRCSFSPVVSVLSLTPNVPVRQ